MNSNVIDYKIQNIILPKNSKKDIPDSLLFRLNKPQYCRDENGEYCWTLTKGNFDTFTYLNSLSVRKWDKYTNALGYNLHLKVKGAFWLSFFGHWCKADEKKYGSESRLDYQISDIRALSSGLGDVYRNVLMQDCAISADLGQEDSEIFYFDTAKSESVEGNDEPEEIVIKVPYSDASVIAFVITADTPVSIYDAYWSAECYEDGLNDVNISLCTTTYKKESYIKKNIEKIRDEILFCSSERGIDELSEHLYVNIVDNARTLTEDDVVGSNISLHFNPNVGGAGGFARGMIETLDLKESGNFDATHILLMDDDIEVLPESIKRTYGFLRLLKAEYTDYFISGSMLNMSQKEILREDVGYISRDTGMWRSQKRSLNLSDYTNVVKNEEDFDMDHCYAPWWYCVVPIKFVRHDNLPIPLFFRGDDIEFSLRNSAKCITLNGVCVWHLEGEQKYNVVTDKYLVYRNLLFLQAVSGVIRDIDFLSEIKQQIKFELRRFNYINADLLLDAIEDFLKGPNFFAEANNEEIITGYNKNREEWLPIEFFSPVSVDFGRLYDNSALNRFDNTLYNDTDNGHLLKDEVLINDTYLPGVPYDYFESSKVFRRKHCLLVNPNTKTAILRSMDKTRYREISLRLEKLLKRYENEEYELRNKYRDYSKKFYSSEFWKRYLGRLSEDIM